jgi:CubicO group peptidase (beta-lactamase class C family)
MRTKSFAPIIVFIFTAVLFHTAQCQSAQSIDSLIETKMKESGIVGMGAAIIVNKKIAWIKGFGFADRENKIPFTASTIMNTGSISKTFTGFCLMKAVEEKRLSLDEDINGFSSIQNSQPLFPRRENHVETTGNPYIGPGRPLSLL